MSNIPKLRFPEFKGEWEEKKLGECLTLLYGKDWKDKSSTKKLYPVLGTGGVISYIDEFIYDKPCVLIGRKGSINNPVFIDKPFWTVDTQFYSEIHEGYSPKFLYYIFCTENWSKHDESTGVPSLSAKNVENTHKHIPSFPEQQKIADFLSNVDSIITAETKILNTLQKKKKALMQKLFTRQLRFKSADGTDFPAWEEKKFSEVFIYHQTNTFSRNMLNYEEGDTYNIHYGDILVKFGSYIDFDNSKIPFINSDVTLNKFVSDSFLKDGDIIIADTAEDESAGKVSEVYNINNKKALSGLHTILCRPKQIFASKYLGYFMNSNVYHKQIVKLLVGTKVLSINKSVIADTIIQIPCLAEQQKIADCLSSMDSLIQTQQKVVTTWQQRKKALLQQMFV